MRKTWEIQRHRISKSHHEAAREDPGWEDQKESGARIRGRTTGIQKGKRKDLWDVCIKTAGREEVGDARENGSGICGPSQEDGVCRRFGQNSREQTRTTGNVGGMEEGVQEARMWVGHQREELTISLEGKEIKQVDGFVYLG